MKRKEKIALGIFIFSILAVIVLIILLISQINITGKVIGDFESEKIAADSAQQITCSDSDSGIDYDVKGVVRYCVNGNCINQEDSCSGKTLTEWYCENNEKYSAQYLCNYDCYLGICVNLVTKYVQPNIGGGSGGGGSSSGSSSSQEVPAITYELGELSSEQSIELNKGENIKFKIAGSEYTLTLQDSSESQATVGYSGGTFALLVGEDKKIDLNNDGSSDIYMNLKSINTVTKKQQVIINLASFYG